MLSAKPISGRAGPPASKCVERTSSPQKIGLFAAKDFSTESANNIAYLITSSARAMSVGGISSP
jgi:hypothetical protein